MNYQMASGQDTEQSNESKMEVFSKGGYVSRLLMEGKVDGSLRKFWSARNVDLRHPTF